MNRVVLLLLVPIALAGCKKDEAVQALIQIDPKQLANCVVLQVLSPEGETLAESTPLPRPDEDRKMTVAIFREKLPADVRLRARAFWGATKCEEPRYYNGGSELTPVRFKSGSQDIDLTVPAPSEAEDADRDGYVSAEFGGVDCDDRAAQRRPGVQELCDASDDLNCDGRRGCDDATCSAQTCSRAATALVFLPSELSAKAGECTAVRVERRDSTGATANLNFATPIVLSSSLPTGVTFHADAACQSSAPPPSIPANNSSIAVYVRSTLVGQATLSATSPLLQAASLSQTLLPGPAKKFAFTSANKVSQAGECSAVSLELRDEFNNLSPDTLSSVTLNPASTHPEEGFYSDAACTTPLVATALPPSATMSFYFRGTRAPSSTLVARSGTTALQAQEVRTVSPLPASKLSLSNPAPQTFLAGQCSPATNVRITDKYDNLSPLPQAQTITLSTTPEIGLEVYWGSGCVANQRLDNKILDPRGNTESLLSFKGKTGGTVDVKLSNTTVGEVSQSQTVVPVVRRGSCRMEIGETTKSCPIGGPAAVTLARSFLVFQATSDNDAPSTSFVRCSLTTANVECKRNTATGHAAIDWQVVELHQGLFVQHLPDVACSNSAYRLPQNVSESNTFLLFSNTQDGETVGGDDFAAIRLASANSINATVQGGCNVNQNFSIQAVQFTNSDVRRNTTGVMDKELLTISGLPTTTPSRAIVMATWLVSTTGQDIYKRVVRGEIDPQDSTKLLFRRGAGKTFTSNDIPQISWERITFPTNTLVQTQVFTVADGETNQSVTLATPVDSTRTLLLTSSQLSGQGGGETSNETNDVVGAATGRLSLTGGNQFAVTRDNRLGAASWTAYAIQFDP